ncbi:MAG TPA: hypothetical protein VM754_09125, partial [Actinomycetota bacterium]|nr:hypothetical protein [Actinomycetota bacterium]
MDVVDRIAETVLYEGYILWPYRRSALKNQQRWTFGGIYPPAYSASTGHTDACTTQTQVLVEGDDRTEVEISVRFLQVVRRQAVEMEGDRPAERDAVQAGGRRHLSWDESVERRVDAPRLSLGKLAVGTAIPVAIPSGSATERLDERAALIRSWHSVEGRIRVSAEPLDERLWKLTVHIANLSDWEGTDRPEAVRRSMVSTHTVLRAAGGICPGMNRWSAGLNRIPLRRPVP